MILKKGAAKFPLPERTDPIYTYLGIYNKGDPEQHPDSYLILCRQVYPHEISNMLAKERSLRGRPTLYTIDRAADGDLLVLWPIPDQDLHAHFEYCPARKVL